MEFQLRPTLSMLRAIASIERSAGNWDRLALNNAVTTERARSSALQRCVNATLALERTTSEPPETLRRLLSAAYQCEFKLSLLDIQDLYRTLTATSEDAEIPLRSGPQPFERPDLAVGHSPLVFRTISPFLIEQRFSDLLSWTEGEFEHDTLHPLMIIGVFHLCFLQISPFPKLNHCMALVVSKHLLVRFGYDFIELAPLTSALATDKDRYFAALRKAEKTAGGDWSTINAWFEVFFGALSSCAEMLVSREAMNLDKRRLNQVQQRIIEIVKIHGPVSRDSIAQKSGINVSTVKYNLGVLSKRGHLKREGGGRATSYTVN